MKFAKSRGVTRGHLIEQALLHHLQAMEELPADAIVPVRIVLTEECALWVREAIARPPEPTEAMRRLFSDR